MSEVSLKEHGTDIATVVETNPVSVLTDAKIYSDFYQHMKAEVEDFDPDLSTASGRKQIASLAYKVTRTKTAIDAAGKKLNEDARKQINKVDEQRRKIRAELDELAATARKPLTEWEAAEEARVEAVATFFSTVRGLQSIPHGASSGDIAQDLQELRGMVVDADLFQDRADEAKTALAEASQQLTEALETAKQAEENERELARLRAEQEARAKADREAAEARERERIEKQKAEQVAAEVKRREEEAAARARAEEQRRAEEAIAKAEAEKIALIREQERKEAERRAAEEREAAEQARREADKRHRAKLTKQAENAVCGLGVETDIATRIVAAIIDGKIPHIEMRF